MNLVINYIPCDSSQIEAIGFDADSGTLGVRFTGGSTYHYLDVPDQVASDFAAAESKGKFFGANIKGRYVYERQPKVPGGEVYGLSQAQEPKYTTSGKNGRLVNRATGTAIPDDEPVLIFRAQDRHAVHAMRAYALVCEQPDHIAVIEQRIADFERFAAANPQRMKEPDSPLPLVRRDRVAETA